MRTYSFAHTVAMATIALSALAHTPMAAAQQAGKTVVVDAPSDAWQARRKQTLDFVRTFNNEKLSKPQREAAYKKFDAVLTQFDKNLFSVTPMEAMDLMQIFYVPNEAGKMEAQLTLVAAIATAGWYDALRFADESGRAEIANNEEFFKRALMTRKDEFIRYLSDEPQAAAKAVATGINYARMAQDGMLKYDVRWPASYGLLRMQCGLSGAKTCPKPAEMAQKDWPAAFEQSAAKVTHYFRINN